MRMHHRERDPNDIYNVSCEAMEHEKRRKLFIGKTQIALLLPPPRRVESEEGIVLTIFGHEIEISCPHLSPETIKIC